MIKAVTFDMWNTLIKDRDYADQRVRCLVGSLRESNVSRSYDQVREAYMATHDYVHRVWRNENYRFVPVEERLEYVLEKLSARLNESRKLKVLKELEELAGADPPQLVEGVKDTLESLSLKYKMGIICDTGLTPGRVLRKVLVTHGILRFFDITVFSDENGYNKPHRTMFEKALVGLCAEPSETLHVGDLLHTDVAGAKAAGMKAVWLNIRGNVNPGHYKPDFEIWTFPELTSILIKIS